MVAFVPLETSIMTELRVMLLKKVDYQKIGGVFIFLYCKKIQRDEITRGSIDLLKLK